jgi:hypothetical protein
MNAAPGMKKGIRNHDVGGNLTWCNQQCSVLLFCCCRSSSEYAFVDGGCNQYSTVFCLYKLLIIEWYICLLREGELWQSACLLRLCWPQSQTVHEYAVGRQGVCAVPLHKFMVSSKMNRLHGLVNPAPQTQGEELMTGATATLPAWP